MTSLATFTSQLEDALETCETIVISGHVSPDGDAVGSSLAMALALAKRGFTPQVILGSYSDKFYFLEGEEFIVDTETEVEGDLFISVDCGDFDRLPENAQAAFKKAKITANIDHHISNDSFADINYVEIISSTCELAYNLIDALDIEIDLDIANALFLGILTDTGGFRFDSMTKDTFCIVGELVERGVPFTRIMREIFYLKTKPEVDIFKTVLDKMKVDDGISYSALTISDMKRAGAVSSDLDGVVNYLLDIEGIHTSILLTERNSKETKASFRSNELNVCTIANTLGGGGHEKAAGATIELPYHKAVDAAVKATKEHKNNN